MSRLIKSPYAHTAKDETKTIEIKQIRHIVSEEIFLSDQDNVEVEEQVDPQELIEQARIEAEQIVQQALDEANSIRLQMEQEREQTYQEMQSLKEQAYEEGYSEGFNKGENEAFTQYESIIHDARVVVDSSKRDYLETIEKAEPIILDLAIAVSKKIIGTTIDENATAWQTLLKNAILEVREHEEVKIYVHPKWYERTLLQKEELLGFLSCTQELYIYPDSQQNEFSCIIETPFGRIDATLDSQLEEVKVQLHEKLKEAADERS